MERDDALGSVVVHVPQGCDVSADRLRVCVEKTLSFERRRVEEVSVTLLDDAEIRDLNFRYLGHDRPTDVIAFALGGAEDLVGDVYVGWRQAARQAEELEIPFGLEIARLVVHGTLHVLGYDHPEGKERYASDMFVRQEAILEEIESERRALSRWKRA